MSGEKNENENEDLKAFEAALGSLRPRADRLDSGWRALLAKEASLTVELDWSTSLPSPVGRGAGGESCNSPAGHQFLCIRCGSTAPMAGRARRWAWPAAFSTMTAVAAILLAMLVTRTDRQTAERGNEQDIAMPALPSGNNTKDGRQLESWIASEKLSRPPLVSGTDEMPYLTLRDQVLRDGVESWKSPVWPVVTAAGTTESPLSYREQLDRLLKQQGLRGS